MINRAINLTHVVLETPRLILRAFRYEDLDDFFEYASVDGVGEMAGWVHHSDKNVSHKILESFIQTKKTFAIVYKANNKVIGSLGLEKSHFPRTYYPGETVRDIGYVLSKDYWGQGLMSEAVKAVIDYCFNTLKMSHLTVGHFIDNIRSKRVIEKSGFTYAYAHVFTTRMGTKRDTREYILNNPKK